MPGETISVIIPAYNRERLIGRAIRSALGQSYPASEIVVVDDGSGDGTIDAALKACPEAVVVRMPHSGAQAARAAGIRAATGDWVAFLDSDDWWLPHKLERQMEKAAQGFSVVHGPGLVRQNGRDVFFAVPPLEGSVYPELLRGPGPMYPSLLVRRECFEKAGYPDPAIAAMQEWDTSLLLARRYAFGWVDQPLFVYEVQDDSISGDDYRGLRGYEQIVCKWWDEILSVAGRPTGRKHYRRMAKLAGRLTGPSGYAHYMRMGEARDGCAQTPEFALFFSYAASRARPWLAEKFPGLRVFCRSVKALCGKK
jgi:glycosyltransferase involved in cell wall biosynthesis